MADICNLRAGRAKRCAALVVPSVLGALSLAGVAVRPNVHLRAAEFDLELATRRVEQRRDEAQRLRAFEASGGLERSRSILTALRRRLPSPLPDLELHGLLRRVAAGRGLELDALAIRAPRDAGLAHLEDVAGLREVRMEGSGELTGLIALIGDLRSLGQPTCVLEFQASRANMRGRQYWTVVLGLFESHGLGAFGAPENGAQAASDEGEYPGDER